LLLLFEIAAMLTALFFLLPLGVPYLENAEAHALVRHLLAFDRQCTDFVQTLVPLKVSGYGTARGIIVVLALVVSRVFSGARRHFADNTKGYGGATDVEKPASAPGAAIIAGGVKSRTRLLEIMTETKNKLEAMGLDHESTSGGALAGAPGAAYIAERSMNRTRLLEIMAETKGRLEAMQRDLAFLSIDVVGSTTMKVGEDRMKIEVDFREYKKFIDKAISKNGALTAAWTPDGVMICFPTIDFAVGTAKSVITGLQRFNKKVKTIRTNFRVRCGVNSGRVYYDPSIPMEEMSDHVIDVAGHMQKYTAPDTVALSKSAMDLLAPQTREGFRPAGKKVDELEVCQWGNW
jgi:class 3 adenylate cyclase